MSIENTLERIAAALETIAGLKQGAAPAIDTPKVDVSEPIKKTTKKDAEKPSGVGSAGKPGEEKEYTQAEVLDALKGHADEFDSESTIKLMVRHGADKETPAVRTIPSENYGALMADIKADLAKKQAKGKIA